MLYHRMQLSHEQLISVDIETENTSLNFSSNIYVPENPNTLS